MLQTRFHGRGGQGMKTASRVVGTAAALDGCTAQDALVYGAERRGAPMTAYARIATGPILERGLVSTPDLLVVADDTLLDDPGAAPLAGVQPEAPLLLNTPHSSAEVRARYGRTGPVEAHDFTALALDWAGSAAGVSAALAAAACRMLGLSRSSTMLALAQELADLDLPEALIEANLKLADLAYACVRPIGLRPAPCVPSAPLVVDVAYDPPELGTASVMGPANTPLRRTGSWRIFRPMVDFERCTRCWICFLRCPEGAISLDAEDRPIIDYEVCKGCLICVEECPIHVITHEREVRPWSA
ncbi:MAG: 2-oxoacid:acceptor oxidoreductase family protein [Deltaproteobacteria bacterium]|nr:2-oxoacid:acceptor oxidoreductase family protein [Deltaproteobacteria bacterium]MBI3078816.1 2-oxoacid:acceptor oxidoreductase family protein [Deltaproteobacteria bacterium]